MAPGAPGAFLLCWLVCWLLLVDCWLIVGWRKSLKTLGITMFICMYVYVCWFVGLFSRSVFSVYHFLHKGGSF
jgi:hypothetical protein